MKPRLFSCLAIGAVVAVTLAALILSTSYGKSRHGSPHSLPRQGFEVKNDKDLTLRGMYIPPAPAPEPSLDNNKMITTSAETTSIQQTSNHSLTFVLQSPYMLALHTAEQLTMSTSHFVEFMNLVNQWNLTGVEPVVYGSRMNALRSMHADDVPGSVHYHVILNTSLMRQKLSKCLTGRTENTSQESNGYTSSPLFAPLSIFLRQSMRAVTLVYFSRHMNVLGKQLNAAADSLLNSEKSLPGVPVIECTDILRESGISDRVEVLLNHELIIEGASVENFTVIQAFCVRKVEMSLVKLREEILTLIHRNQFHQIDVSVVFISWQGKFTRSFTDMNTLYRCRLPSSQIEPSQQVVATADKFLTSLGLEKQSYIAIHVRFEKLFRTAFRRPQRDARHFLDCCMLKLDALLNKVKELNNFTSEGSTLLLHDYGSYGTDACQHNGGWRSRSVCVDASRHLLSLLNETRASEFDPVEFDAPQNSGFVSLVEGVSLSEGHSLVVLGGGSFQVSITGRYTDRFKREYNRSGTVYSICTGRDNVHNLELGEIKECT